MALEGQPDIGSEGTEKFSPLDQAYAALPDKDRTFVDGMWSEYQSILEGALPDLTEVELDNFKTLVRGATIDSLKQAKGGGNGGSVLSGDDFT